MSETNSETDNIVTDMRKTITRCGIIREHDTHANVGSVRKWADEIERLQALVEELEAKTNRQAHRMRLKGMYPDGWHGGPL